MPITKLIRTSFLVVACLSLVISKAIAFDGFTVQGSHTVKLKPQRLRLATTVSAEGKDPKDALDKLHQHEQNVKAVLAELKADPKSIAFGTPVLKLTTPGMPDEGNNPNVAYRRQMRMMMEGRVGGGMKGEEDEEELPKVAVATSLLHAEWSVPDDADTIARLPMTLEQKLTAKDIKGKNNKFELDDDAQQKIADAMAAQQGNDGAMFAYQSSFDSSENGRAGGLRFTFVSEAKSKDIEAASKAAYENANNEAKLWSNSTGIKLGKIKSITTGRSSDASLSGFGDHDSDYPIFSSGRNPMSFLLETLDKDSVVESKSPDHLGYTLRISITYSIDG